MQYNIFKRTRLFIVLFATLFLLQCDFSEKIENLCGDDITLTFEGRHLVFNQDNEIKNIESAQGASIKIYEIRYDSIITDTIISQGTFDASGVFEYTPEQSGCGINNIYVEAAYTQTANRIPLIQSTDTMDYVCCDRQFNFEFKEYVTDVASPELTCSNLDTTIVLNITNKDGLCNDIGTEDGELFGNKIAFTTKQKIKLDLNPIINIGNGFTIKRNLSITPAPDANGEVILENSTLSVVFGINTETDTVFSTTVNIPSTCIDASGNAQGNGNIKVDITAEVCDLSAECICPVGGNEIYPESLEDQKIVAISLPEGEEFTTTSLDKYIDLELAEGCQLFIDDIKRLESSEDAFISNALPWNIVSPQKTDLPMLLTTFSSFEIISKFKPTDTNEYKETYEVFISVINENATKTKNCSFLVSFDGKGCDDMVCPTLTIIDDQNKSSIIDKNSNIRFDNNALTIDFSNDRTLVQQMSKTTLDGGCFPMTTHAKLDYSILLDEDEDNTCTGHYIVINKMNGANDNQYFTSSISGKENLTVNDEVKFHIEFDAPSIQTHLETDHDSLYTGQFIIEVYTNNDILVCTQELYTEAVVAQLSFDITRQNQMYAFSQISDLDSIPSYEVYQIGYSTNDKLTGRILTLDSDPDFGEPEELTDDGVITIPSENVFSQFYFDVDNPDDTDVNNHQIPELYLVNSPINHFDYITTSPVQTYSNANDFISQRNQLAEKIFDTNGFMSSDNSTFFSFDPNNGQMWNNSIQKGDMKHPNGIELEVGGVYIIWSSISKKIDNLPSNAIGGYCDVALIYITELDHGKGANTHHLGTVGFLIGYPITVITD